MSKRITRTIIAGAVVVLALAGNVRAEPQLHEYDVVIYAAPVPELLPRSRQAHSTAGDWSLKLRRKARKRWQCLPT
jgi:hypothetical protein